MGFGLFSDGIGHTRERARTGYLFDYHGVLFGWGGGGITHLQRGSDVTSIPDSHPSQDSHYRTGEQATINGPIGSAGAVNAMLDVANDSNDLLGVQQHDLGLIVKGIYLGEPRGFVYIGNNNYRADSNGETVSHTQLINAASANNNQPLTWTLVHTQIAERAGIDRDADGTLDSDEVNDPPQGNPDTVNVTSAAAVTINPLSNDTGSGIVLVAPSAWSLRGGTVSLENNRLRYKPKAGFNGEDKIWYTIQDSRSRSSWSEITITISSNGAANDVPPTSSADNVTTTTGTTVTIDVLANDTGTGLTLSAPNPWSLRGGTVALVNNKLVYKSKAGFTGNDNIWYTFSDSRGRTNSGQVNITVNSGNTTAPFPIANADTYTVPRGSTRTLNILANDTPNGLAIDTLYAYTAKGGRTTKLNSQEVSYTPKVGFTGVDDFWYVLIDAQGRKNSAKVTINVTP